MSERRLNEPPIPSQRNVEPADTGFGSAAPKRIRSFVLGHKNAAKPAPTGDRDAAWDRLRLVNLKQRHLARHRLITNNKKHPADSSFDVLRTRLTQAMKSRGWTRVAVTSPTAGCGKTFVAANLALSLARQSSARTVLMDMDLRDPSLARALGVPNPGFMRDFLTGVSSVEDHLLRVGHTLAIGVNKETAFDAGELMQEPATARVLEKLQATLQPDMLIYDLPPVLSYDDVVAFLPLVDGVLLVSGGRNTKADEIREVERLLEDRSELLGVVHNMAEA